MANSMLLSATLLNSGYLNLTLAAEGIGIAAS
jgi:hypothetical protein